jgi:hypothetical protein
VLTAVEQAVLLGAADGAADFGADVQDQGYLAWTLPLVGTPTSIGGVLDLGQTPQEAGFLRFDDLSFTGAVHAAGLAFEADLGILGAEVAGGSFDLDVGLDAEVSGGADVYLADLGATPAAYLLDLSPTAGAVNVVLPVQAAIGAWSTASIPGEPPKITLADSDLLAPDHPDVEAALEQALGLNPSALSLALDAAGHALRMNLQFTKALAPGLTLPMNLDLSSLGVDGLSKLIDVGSQGVLSVEGDVTLSLSLGLDYSDPANVRPFLYDSSTAVAHLRLSGTDIQFETSLGALGIFIGSPSQPGTVALDADGDGASVNPASFTVGLNNNNGDGRHYFTEPILSALSVGATGQADASLPVFFPTASQYLDPAHPSLAIHVADLGDPVGSLSVEDPPDFATAISTIDLTSSLDALVGGWDGLFQFLENALRDCVLGVNLPIVGDKLIDAARFLRSLREDVVAALEFAQQGGGSAVMVNGADAQDGGVLTPLVVRQKVFEALGPAGLGWLGDLTGEGLVTVDDVVMTASPEEVYFHIVLASDLVQFQIPFDLDLGVPGLGLNVDGQVAARVGFQFDFGFGVSRSDGVYFDVSDSDELTVNFDVGLTHLDASGQLLFLQLDVNDLAAGNPALEPEELGLAPDVINGFAGEFAIDLTDPSGDGKLTLAELASVGDFSQIVDARLSAEASMHLGILASMGGIAMFPSVSAELHLSWGWSEATNYDLTVPLIQLTDIHLNVGEFFNRLFGPVLGVVNDIIDPIRPILDALTAPIPVISDLAGTDISLCDLASIFGYSDVADFIEAADAITDLLNVVNVGDDLWIDFGGYTLAGYDPFGGPASQFDLSNAVPDAAASAFNIGDAISGLGDSGLSDYFGSTSRLGGGGGGGGGIDFIKLDTDPNYLEYGDVFDGHYGNRVAGDVPDDNATDILLIEGTDGADTILLKEHDVGITATGEAPRDGRLHSTAVFDVTLGAVTWHVTVPDNPSNQTLQHLVGDINQALGAAGVPDGIVRAVRVGDRIRIETAGQGRLAELKISNLNATAVNVLHLTEGARGVPLLVVDCTDPQGHREIVANWRLADGTPAIEQFRISGLGYHDTLGFVAGQGNDDLIGGVGTNDLYAWSFDPLADRAEPFDPLTVGGGDGVTRFGAFVDPATGLLYDDDGGGAYVLEDTGLNRMLGQARDDRLYGGTGLDFLYGNGGADELYTRNGELFEAGFDVQAGDSEDPSRAHALEGRTALVLDVNAAAAGPTAFVRLLVGGSGDLVEVEIPTARAGDTGDLLADVNAALAAAGISGQVEAVALGGGVALRTTAAGPTARLTVLATNQAARDVLGLADGQVATGELIAGSTVFAGLTLDHAADVDWYSLRLVDVGPAGGIYVSGASPDDRIRMRLYGIDDDGQTLVLLGSDEATGEGISFADIPSLEPGTTYLLQVVSVSDMATVYDLTVDIGDGGPAVERDLSTAGRSLATCRSVWPTGATGTSCPRRPRRTPSAATSRATCRWT